MHNKKGLKGKSPAGIMGEIHALKTRQAQGPTYAPGSQPGPFVGGYPYNAGRPGLQTGSGSAPAWDIQWRVGGGSHPPGPVLHGLSPLGAPGIYGGQPDDEAGLEDVPVFVVLKSTPQPYKSGFIPDPNKAFWHYTHDSNERKRFDRAHKRLNVAARNASRRESQRTSAAQALTAGLGFGDSERISELRDKFWAERRALEGAWLYLFGAHPDLKNAIFAINLGPSAPARLRKVIAGETRQPGIWKFRKKGKHDAFTEAHLALDEVAGLDVMAAEDALESVQPIACVAGARSPGYARTYLPSLTCWSTFQRERYFLETIRGANQRRDIVEAMLPVLFLAALKKSRVKTIDVSGKEMGDAPVEEPPTEDPSGIWSPGAGFQPTQTGRPVPGFGAPAAEEPPIIEVEPVNGEEGLTLAPVGEETWWDMYNPLALASAAWEALVDIFDGEDGPDASQAPPLPLPTESQGGSGGRPWAAKGGVPWAGPWGGPWSNQGQGGAGGNAWGSGVGEYQGLATEQPWSGVGGTPMAGPWGGAGGNAWGNGAPSNNGVSPTMMIASQRQMSTAAPAEQEEAGTFDPPKTTGGKLFSLIRTTLILGAIVTLGAIITTGIVMPYVAPALGQTATGIMNLGGNIIETVGRVTIGNIQAGFSALSKALPII